MSLLQMFQFILKNETVRSATTASTKSHDSSHKPNINVLIYWLHISFIAKSEPLSFISEIILINFADCLYTGLICSLKGCLLKAVDPL